MTHEELIKVLKTIINDQPVLVVTEEQFETLKIMSIVPIQEPTGYLGKLIINPKL